MKAQKFQRRRQVVNKKKPAYKHGKKTAPKLFSTREVKHIETASDSKNVQFVSSGQTQMPNGQVFILVDLMPQLATYHKALDVVP